MADSMLSSGVAKAVITPPVGVDLCGFGNRPGPSAGVHDDLHAGAIYFSDGSCELFIITADLIGLHRDDVRDIRQRVTDKTGVPGAHIMVGCSHTHGGPATPCIQHLGLTDLNWFENTKETMAELCAEAQKSASSAEICSIRVPLTLGVNRRESRKGQVCLGINPEGVTHTAADVLAVRRGGTPMATLVCHAAHAVCLGGDNVLITADWPGYAQRSLTQAGCGEGLFLQGCCGNINCKKRGTFEMAEELGRELSTEVAGAVQQGEFTSAVRLGAVTCAVELPLAEPPTLEEAEAMVGQFEKELRAQKAKGSYGPKMMAEGYLAWAKAIRELSRQRKAGRTVPFEIQALRIGDFACVGLPGEVFFEYAAAIGRGSPFAQTAVAAYTNGNVGYVPTRDAFDEGGYEVVSAIRFYGDTMLTPACETIICESAAAVLRELEKV